MKSLKCELRTKASLIIGLTAIVFLLAGCLASEDISDITGSAVDEDNLENDLTDVSKTESAGSSANTQDKTITSEKSTATIKSVKEELPPEKNMPQIDPEVLKLVNYAKETTRYRYDAREDPLFRAITHYTISDNKIKIVLPEKNYYDRKNYYNTLYLDTKSKIAIAFCEDRVRCADLNRPFDISYEMNYRTSPRDRALEILEVDNVEIVGGETIYGRPAIIVEFEKNDTVYRYSLDRHFGLVTHAIINPGSENAEEYKYELTGINIGEDEMIHQFMFG